MVKYTILRRIMPSPSITIRYHTIVLLMVLSTIRVLTTKCRDWMLLFSRTYRYIIYKT
jgi:hypothetical protein